MTKPNQLVEHPTWAVIDSSKLQAFMACPRSYFFEYVLGWRPDKVSNHLHFGTAWHIAMEILLREGFSPEAAVRAYDGFLETYRSSPDFQSDTDDLFTPKNPERAFLAIALYAKKYADDLQKYEVMHTEVSGTVAIDENRVLYFKMDSIMRELSSNKIVSLEHKTGSSTWGWDLQWGLKTQIGTYTHCLYSMFGVPDVKGVIVNGTFFKKVKKFDANSIDFMRVPVYKTPAHMKQWLYTTNYYIDQLMREFELVLEHPEDIDVLTAFPCNTESCTKYGGCPYLNLCLSWSNPLARLHSAPSGFKVEFWDPRDEITKSTMQVDLRSML